MRRRVRLTSFILAAMMLPAGVAPALGQAFPPGKPGIGGGDIAKPPPSGFAPPPAPRPQAVRPPAAAPLQAQLQAEAEPGLADEELRTAEDDPPIVVGRIARSDGTASLRLPGSEEWQPAGLNTSVTAGTGIWTEPGARLALEVAQSRLFLDGGSAVQLDELDDDGMRATIAQGAGFLRLQGIGTDDGMVEVATPEASLATVVDGRYLIEAAAQDGSRPGRIAVYEGSAEITPVGGEAVRLGAGEALILAPGQAPQRVAAGGASPLMAWALSTEPRRPVPVVARGMTGIAELSNHGSWGAHAEYGDVWYPPVQQDWQPYRDGSWQWREPWGWTWVDAAPWGYAPAHYGRWVQVGPRWAWAPQPVRVAGAYVRPAWAPALVAFFGGVVVGQATRPVGWVPLAPREPFYPWYRASPRYVQRLNYRQVPNVVVVRNVWVERGRDFRWDDDHRRDGNRARFHDRRLDEFRNRRAAIQVPERVMLSSLPVRAESRRLAVQDARRAELYGGLPLRPGLETRGLTPRSAERLGFSPAQVRATEERYRGTAPPPAVRAALADRRRDDARDRLDGQRDAAQREAQRDRNEAQRDAARDAAQRDAARDRADGQRDAAREGAQRDAARDRTDAQRDAAREAAQREAARDRADAQRGAAREGAERDAARDGARREPGAAQDRSERQALRERLLQQRRESGEQGRPGNDAARTPRDPQRAEALRQQQEQRQQQRQQQQARPPGEARREQGEEGRPQQDQARQQQLEQARRQQQEQRQQQQARPQPGEARRQPGEEGRPQQDQVRQQQLEQARRQQQEQRQQQQEQTRRQQQEQGRQQQDQAGRQQQDQARQQQQQQEQARRQQQEQSRQQQQQQQEQARRQQQEQSRQQQQQQQEQARRQQQEQSRQQQQQQQEQARQQQQQARQQQQEQARQQQQEQARQQQQQARQQQQEQARQQQQQARQQQQEQARQQQAEQRRQERQQERQR